MTWDEWLLTVLLSAWVSLLVSLAVSYLLNRRRG